MLCSQTLQKQTPKLYKTGGCAPGTPVLDPQLPPPSLPALPVPGVLPPEPHAPVEVPPNPVVELLEATLRHCFVGDEFVQVEEITCR